MTFANMPVIPIIPANAPGENCVLADGITKREYFAGLAMQAQISDGGARTNAPAICAEFAVECADALLAELQRREEPSNVRNGNAD